MRAPKKHILTVDDDEVALSCRQFLLETRGYLVTSAQTGREALRYLKQVKSGTIDLLVTDLVMPKMDGNELVRRAKELHPHLRAMIVSGSVTAYDRAHHADAFLPKGAAEPAVLLERIRILCTRKRGSRKV